MVFAERIDRAALVLCILLFAVQTSVAQEASVESRASFDGASEGATSVSAAAEQEDPIDSQSPASDEQNIQISAISEKLAELETSARALTAVAELLQPAVVGPDESEGGLQGDLVSDEPLPPMGTLVAVDLAKSQPVSIVRSPLDLRIKVVAGSPTVVIFPAKITGGFKQKHSALSLERQDSKLIMFAQPEIRLAGERLVVVLDSGAIITLEVTPAADASQGDIIVKVEQ